MDRDLVLCAAIHNDHTPLKSYGMPGVAPMQFHWSVCFLLMALYKASFLNTGSRVVSPDTSEPIWHKRESVSGTTTPPATILIPGRADGEDISRISDPW